MNVGIWISVILNIILFMRLNSINKEIRSVKAQLDDYNKLKSYKKVNVNLFNKNIENLAYSINLNSILFEVITAFYESFIEKNIEPEIDIIKESLIVIGNGIAIKRVE